MFEIGSSLREARIRRGEDFPPIERATKIRAKYLRALEDEQFDVLPSQTYVKGFLRTYAEYLGLDGQLYVDEFNSRYATGEDELIPIRRPNVGRQTRRVEARYALIAVAVIGIVTAVVFGFGRSSGGSSAPTTSTPAKKHHHNAAAHRPRTRAVVVLTGLAGGSWVKALDARANRQLFEGTIEQGGSQTFRGKRLVLNVGRPASLRWEINGKSRPAPGDHEAIYVVTKKGLRRAPAAG